MRNRRLWIVTVATLGTLLSQLGPARGGEAAEGRTVALWSMDEARGARSMRDATGQGNTGTIGREVGVGGGYYHFERLEPDTPPARPGHLVVVPDRADLDPGERDFAITVRLRTRDSFGNIVQKGQATVAGGSFKMQIPSGHVQCWFRGSGGQLLVAAPNKINDGRWHTVRCVRTRAGVSLTIDGRTVAGKWGWTGSVANSWPLSIGGKTDCDQIDVGCDYFAGDIDYLAVEAADHWN